jgi:hypothetical protein
MAVIPGNREALVKESQSMLVLGQKCETRSEKQLVQNRAGAQLKVELLSSKQEALIQASLLHKNGFFCFYFLCFFRKQSPPLSTSPPARTLVIIKELTVMHLYQVYNLHWGLSWVWTNS